MTMMPENTRVLRRERRKAWKGTPRGRRSTHKTETTYGAEQKRRDWLANWNAARAAAAAEGEN